MNDLIQVDKPQTSFMQYLSGCGCEFPDDLPYDEWGAMAPQLRRAGTTFAFALGDWLNHGESHYGEKYAQAIEETGYEYSYLRTVSWVANQIPLVARRDILSLEFHRVVAAKKFDEEDRVLLLDAAEQNRFRRDAFREYVKEYLTLKALPEPPEDQVSSSTASNLAPTAEEVPVGAVVDVHTGLPVEEEDVVDEPKVVAMGIEHESGLPTSESTLNEEVDGGHDGEEPRPESFAEAAQEALDVTRDKFGVIPQVNYEQIKRNALLNRLYDTSIALRDTLKGANPDTIKMTKVRREALANWKKALEDCEA